MSIAFSSEDEALMNQTIDVPLSYKRDDTILVDNMYEISRCVEWINNHHYSKIALQFPDSLLADAANVALKIEDMTSKQIFILGDTSYGSCCVDEVAAEHASADAIIHFGHTCLSPTKRLPVLYVFGKQPIDIDDTVASFRKFFSDKKCFVILLYEVTYFYCIGKIFEQLEDYENIVLSQLEIPGEKCEPVIVDKQETGLLNITKNHRHFFLPKDQNISNYKIFYVGCRDATMTNFMLTLSTCTFYSYNPLLKSSRAETLDVNKYLMKRYYYIEKAKDANIIGILVGTLGVSNYLTTIHHIKEIIKNAGKKCYTIVVGKLNTAKLANFAEIEIFVNVACPESSLIDCKDFYQPIITPHELEIALNQARSWTGEYILDFSQILPGAASHIPLCENDSKGDVSLVTGKLRFTELSCSEGSKDISETALITRNNMELSTIHSQGAGEFLSQRSWKGLEQKLGETAVPEIEEGQRGIASLYEDETNYENV